MWVLFAFSVVNGAMFDRVRLTNQFKQGSINDRRLALNELAEVPSEVAVPFLKDLLVSQDFSLRKFVAMGLGNHCTLESFEVLEKLVEGEKDANVLAEAANSLYEFGDRAYPLFKKLYSAHENWLLRQTILSLVMETNEAELIWAIATQGLEDSHQTVKETAIFAVGQLLKSPLNSQAFARLEPLACDPVWRTRWRTAIALQHGPKEQVQPVLLRLKEDEHFRVVAAAMDVLNVI